MHLWNFLVSRWINKDSVNKCFREMVVYKACIKNFPGSPVVKNSPSNAGRSDSIPGQEVKIPHALRPEKQKPKIEAIL